MDNVIELAKAVAAIVGALVAFHKVFMGGDGDRDRRLAERHERVKEFFACYDAGSHPMVIEAAFAAAIGRMGISAQEISILLRQEKPTQFVAVYSRVQDYLAPDSTGSQLDLRSIAARPVLRVFLWRGGLVLYFVLAALTAFTGLFLLPDAVGRQNWRDISLAAFNTIVFASAAIIVLIESSRLRWAFELCKGQIPRADRPDHLQPAPTSGAIDS